MASMAIASMWASITAWFTPTVLFCAANLIIGTIFIASKTNNQHQHQDQPNRISRVSSFLYRATSIKLPSTTTSDSQHQYPSESDTATYSSSSRLAQSIHHAVADELYPSEPERQPAHAPSLLERLMSIKSASVNSPAQLDRSPSFLDRVKSFGIGGATATSTQPETVDSDPSHNPEYHVIRHKSEKMPTAKKTSLEMKKSRSELRIATSDSDEEDVDLRRPATARVRGSRDVDEEVDARADDFISRFKQQLKLQRLESLVRFNQMLNRGS